MVVKRAKVWHTTSAEFITVPKLAKMMGMPYATALKLANSGQVPGGVKLGAKRLLFRRVVVEAWLKGTTIG